MKHLRNSIRFCLDFLYPNRCPCCDGFISWDALLCENCRQQIPVNPEQLCLACGRPKEECMCALPMRYDRAMVMSFYEAGAKEGLLRMKDSSSRNFGRFAGETLGKWILTQEDWMMADGIVPVPMSTGKRLCRGYNQAEVIARAISEVTYIPILRDCLKKRHGAPEQHTLSAEQRAENTETFQPTGRNLKGYRLILCDDIITTGNTLDRCAEILKSSGAETVYAAAAAVTRRKREE